MVVFLLVVIAIGVLLLSEEGKAFLEGLIKLGALAFSVVVFILVVSIVGYGVY